MNNKPPPNPPPNPPPSPPAIAWPGSAVLVVDDEEGMRNFLAKTLAPRCGQVLTAGSAEAGEALLRQQRFDLIVLDISLPGKAGLAWLRELREAGNGCEVILITAFADLETAIEALRIGASDFILKPFRTTQLLNAVKHCLERARLARENFVLKRTLQTERGTPQPGPAACAASRPRCSCCVKAWAGPRSWTARCCSAASPAPARSWQPWPCITAARAAVRPLCR